MQLRITKLERQADRDGFATQVNTQGSVGYLAGDLWVTGKLEIPRTALSMTQQEILDAIYKWVKSLLTGTASSGQKNVSVVNGSLFSVDEIVVIRDDNAYETNTIASIASNTLTMTTNLSNTYTTAANGSVDHWEPEEFASVDRPFRLKDNTTGQYVDSFLVTVSDSNDDPLFVIDQALVVKKDLAAGGFVSTNQGAVMYGHGLSHYNDPPKNVLLHSGLGFDILHFVKADGVTLAHIAVDDMWAYNLLFPNAADWDRIFWNSSVRIGVEGTPADVLRLEAPTIKLVGNVEVGSTQKGSDTTDGNGDCTTVFDDAFDSTPIIFIQSNDASGRAVVFDVTAKSTTQFSVKANILTTHKHKIGAIGASAVGATQDTSEESAHTHSFSDTTSAPTGLTSVGSSTHTHTVQSHTHTNWTGYLNPNTGQPSSTETAAGSTHTHTVQAHDHGGTTGNAGHGTSSAPTSTTNVAGSVHTHTSQSPTQDANPTTPHSHGINQQTSAPDSGTTSVASSTHTHTATGTHDHGIDTEAQAATSAPDSGTVTLASNIHIHTVVSHRHSISTEAQSTTSAPDAGLTNVASSGHTHTVSGTTGTGSAHKHTYQYSPYYRALDLRDISGASEICGAVLIDSSEGAVDLYTEGATVAGVVVNFDWLAMLP